MPYRYLEGLTLADYAFEATGLTLEDMFTSAAEALTRLMISNPEEISPQFIRPFSIHSTLGSPVPAAEELLYLFLERLIHIKDAENILVRPKNLLLVEAKEGTNLQCQFYGEAINPRKHRLGIDVKAVTQHYFQIKKVQFGWTATVVVDV